MASRFSPVRKVTRRAAFVAASGRVRADGRSSRPRNTLPAPDRRPRVSFVGRFGTEFAPRRPETRQTFRVRRQARVETRHDGSHLPPPRGHGAHRGNLRQLRHGIQAAGTRAHTTRTRTAPPVRRAVFTRGARAPAQPLRRQLFVRLRAPPWRSIGSSPPLPAQAPSESASKRLSSEDVIKYTKDFIVQFREVRRAPRRAAWQPRKASPRVIAPSGLWSLVPQAASLSFPKGHTAKRLFKAPSLRSRRVARAAISPTDN